ncbi:hypothetical protein UCRPA7_2890 [Phaeoacremonium minimum UCRPA7]|uniref:Uncharacterized protein n=1 Tax=Phaeoacremonium minimum (strain UCR-PA7) TaxID=1286976 RepID=R8BQH1_PHAM7|nr:hypothetical protein UCRPA7_2890 [Phaeoacremonium minimum UCRPA7]EOO01597.1 hypothetical protein UCRPA7_2890 [Phaeoacremonium minimum UCRPA7]
MAPTSEQLRDIANQAERDLNTYQSKQGLNNYSGSDDAGVDSGVEKNFPGAAVKYHPDLSTNSGYNRRIPPEEGGDLDARGRQTKGSAFEGTGGPEDKLAERQRDFGGYDDNDALPRGVLGRGGVEAGRESGDILEQGSSASRANVGRNPPGPGGSKFKGSEYYQPEDVPDSIAAEGYVPPESVVEPSRETEFYERR